MTLTQMNIRIESEMKSAGDAAFAEIGYSPTEAVRELWGFAQRNRNDKQAIGDMMRSLCDPRSVEAEETSSAHRDAEFEEWLERGANLLSAFCVQAGIEPPAIPSLEPHEYDELLACALEEDDERIRRSL